MLYFSPPSSFILFPLRCQIVLHWETQTVCHVSLRRFRCLVVCIHINTHIPLGRIQGVTAAPFSNRDMFLSGFLSKGCLRVGKASSQPRRQGDLHAQKASSLLLRFLSISFVTLLLQGPFQTQPAACLTLRPPAIQISNWAEHQNHFPAHRSRFVATAQDQTAFKQLPGGEKQVLTFFFFPFFFSFTFFSPLN